MRSRIFWAAVIAALVAVTAAACSGSPGEMTDNTLTWDQGAWDGAKWN